MQIVLPITLLVTLVVASFSKANTKRDNFKRLTQYAFNQESGPKRSFQTNALLIIKGGHLIYENYANGYTREKKHILWSASKSITGTLIGIAHSSGLLKLTHKVARYMEVPPHWKGMTIDDLMRMSSGIDWREKYEEDPTDSDVTVIHYGKGRKNIIQYILERPMLSPPGEVFYYSTGDTHLLFHILVKAVGGEQALFEFIRKKLWSPLGVSDYTIEQDPAGNFYGGTHFYLTPRDFAKFGLLQLYRGVWEGEPIYSPNWYDYFRQPAPRGIVAILAITTSMEPSGGSTKRPIARALFLQLPKTPFSLKATGGNGLSSSPLSTSSLFAMDGTAKEKSI